MLDHYFMPAVTLGHNRPNTSYPSPSRSHPGLNWIHDLHSSLTRGIFVFRRNKISMTNSMTKPHECVNPAQPIGPTHQNPALKSKSITNCASQTRHASLRLEPIGIQTVAAASPSISPTCFDFHSPRAEKKHTHHSFLRRNAAKR